MSRSLVCSSKQNLSPVISSWVFTDSEMEIQRANVFFKAAQLIKRGAAHKGKN